MLLFSILKVAKEEGKLNEALKYFSKDNFNLKNKIWHQVFFDPEIETIKTDKTIQKYAMQLILKHLGINVRMTKKEKSVYDNFNIEPTRI